MKKQIVLGAIALLVIVLAFSNPKKEQHSEVVSKSVTRVLNDRFDEKNDKEEKENKLVKLFAGLIVDKMADHKIEYNNYVLFSTGSMIKKGESKTLTIGLFGNAFMLANDDQIREQFDKDKKENN